MLIVQKEVSNIQITCYGEKELKEFDMKYPSTLKGYFNALKWCEYSFGGEKNKLTFGAAAVDSDFYLRLLEGLSCEKPVWTNFSARIEDLYRQENGVDIQHSFNMFNFTQIEISHKNNAMGDPEEIIFTFT